MERRTMIQLLLSGSIFAFLFGTNKDKAEAYIRPPGAVEEDLFLSTCARCGKCAEVCTAKAIVIGHGEAGLSIGTPYIVPREQACDLCMECTKVCTSGALRPKEKEQVKMGRAEIDHDTCLAWQGDECKICYTSCPFYDKAIQLKDHKYPIIDETYCTGCGQCEHVCIAQPAAVRVKTP